MEWEKAKTILVIIFLILNVGLFAMNVYISESGKMTADEVSKITEILSNSDITLDCAIPPENKLLRFINITAADWDYDYISNTFFPNEQNVTRTNEAGNIIYRAGDAGTSVTVTNAYAGSGQPFSELIFSDEYGQGSAESYKKLLGKGFEDFQLIRKTSDETGETYLYNETVKKDILFSSSVEISLLSGGGVTVRVKKYDFVSYVDGFHDIFRADEALLTFAHYKNERLHGNISIESIQLGYGLDSQTPEKTRKAKLYYRIFISGSREPVFIDAVMNTVLPESAV